MRKKKKRISNWKLCLYVFFAVWVLVSIYSGFKFLPDGVNIESAEYFVSQNDIDFLYDLTYFDSADNRIYDQEIFKNVFDIVDSAEKIIVLDFFLFNQDFPLKEAIPITTTLRDKLIAKKQANPDIEILFVTDEINNFYGSYLSEDIELLQDAGVVLAITDLTKLRDVNIIYAGFWRAYLQWFGSYGDGWITHPLGNTDYKVTLRSFLKLLNTKANHRKLIVADSGDSFVSLVTSANPHQASSLHSNVAFRIRGQIAADMINSETAIASFSGIDFVPSHMPDEDIRSGDIGVQFLTEQKIREGLLEEINLLGASDSLDMGMFYLSDRKIVSALLDASNRGATIRLILDPNKDAFAREKNGIPNRQVAFELIKKSKGAIQIRWYDTRGEQYHSKLTIIRRGNMVICFLGSANLTKRNIGNYNLEANVKVVIPEGYAIATEIVAYFEKIWTNDGGQFTLDFEAYKDTSLFKYWLYRFQEFSGFSSF